jgi:hypothetical protein
MGGASTTLTAPTVEALKAMVLVWYQQAKDQGLEWNRHPWDPDHVVQTEEGFSYLVSAHT